jgi:hypothetical protein
VFLVAGILAGAVLVGVGVATMLHATDQLEIATNVDWGHVTEEQS